MGRKKLISVLMPVYNNGDYVSDAIQSVQSQSYTDWELVIINDGSTDHTEMMILPFLEDKRIRYYSHDNQGQATARNRGFLHCTGDYIAFLDGDDLFLPNKLEACLERLEIQGDIVYSAMEIIDQEGHLINTFDISKEYSREDFLAEMLFRNQVIPSTVMAKRFCLEQERFCDGMRGLEDYELFLRWAHYFHFTYICTPLIKYRRHSTGLSAKIDRFKETEKEIVCNYGLAHIKQVINNTSYSLDEKLLLLAKILSKIEYFEETIQELKNAETPLALFYKGVCFLSLNNVPSAIECFAKANNLDNRNAASWNNLGVALAKENKTKEAIQAFKEALHLRKDYMDPSHNLKTIHDGLPLSDLRITPKELRKNLMTYKK